MRSGTTYFRNVLSANPNILAFPGELNEFWTTYGKAPCGTVSECPARTASDLTEETRICIQNFFYEKHRKRNNISQLVYRTYRKTRYYNESILKFGEPFYILNKSTHLMNKISYIESIFPDSRFIFILRDIFSQVNSLKHHHLRIQKSKKLIIKYPEKPGECWSYLPLKKNTAYSSNKMSLAFEDIPRYWIEQNSIALRTLNLFSKNRVFYINFDKLFLKPEAVVSGLNDFLKIKKLKKNFSRKLINNLTSDPINQWKNSLAAEEIETIKKIIDFHITDYNYILSNFSDSF